MARNHGNERFPCASHKQDFSVWIASSTILIVPYVIREIYTGVSHLSALARNCACGLRIIQGSPLARRLHLRKQRKFGQSVKILAAMIPSQDPKMPAG
jgi:hypothetical protein